MPPFSRLYLTFTELVWAIVTLFRPFIHKSMSPPQRVYQTSTMFTLPDELVLKIMTNLGIQDLHSCAQVCSYVASCLCTTTLTLFQVCRPFSQLVRTDVQLQLNIGLRRTGMIEGAPSPVHNATADKSTALRQYARRYRNNSFELQRVSFGQDEACTWQRNLDGSVCYVRRRDTENTIDFCVHRLSSPVRGLEAKSWEISMREFVGGALYGVTADVAQDLAVISSSSLTSWCVFITPKFLVRFSDTKGVGMSESGYFRWKKPVKITRQLVCPSSTPYPQYIRMVATSTQSRKVSRSRTGIFHTSLPHEYLEHRTSKSGIGKWDVRYG